jgi:hypothetical protein
LLNSAATYADGDGRGRPGTGDAPVEDIAHHAEASFARKVVVSRIEFVPEEGGVLAGMQGNDDRPVAGFTWNQDEGDAFVEEGGCPARAVEKSLEFVGSTVSVNW